jgi:hypothetical protein
MEDYEKSYLKSAYFEVGLNVLGDDYKVSGFLLLIRWYQLMLINFQFSFTKASLLNEIAPLYIEQE